MIPTKHFYMIRHGESEANAARISAGSLDSPLTEKGIQQAKAVQQVVEALTVKPRQIVHSQLSRARDTAIIINESLNIPMHEEPGYAEIHAGEWEGASHDDCPRFFSDWIDPPGGEAFEDFFKRIKNTKINTLNAHAPPVLVVCHGGVFRAFLKLHGIDTTGVENCMLYEFKPKKEEEAIFPWHIWRYEIEETVIRRPVVLDKQDQDSKIA